MTAFVGRNATEEIGLIKTSANPDLTDWTLKLAKEYSSIPSFIHTFPEYVLHLRYPNHIETSIC